MYDLIIIGAGPAGLSAAIYGRRAGLKTLVLEQNVSCGGQMSWTYEVDNYPGLPGIDGLELGNRFREHAVGLGTTICNETVQELWEKDGMWYVRTVAEEFVAQTVILATGAGYARLQVPGEEKLTGKGVSYCATCDGAFYRDRTVAVVGGGNAALEDVIYLAGLCRKVYLIHRRDIFKGDEVLQKEVGKLAGEPNAKVEILYHHVVEQIYGEECVEGLILKNIKSGQILSLPVEGVFIAVGIQPRTELVKDLLARDEKGYVQTGGNCSTNLPGLFAAGDVRQKMLYQIVTAVSDGAAAGTNAANYCKKSTKNINLTA